MGTKVNNFAFLVILLFVFNRIESATITVTNENDSGAGSLRQAVIDAGSGDTIDFNGSVTQVTLTSGDIDITKNLAITGNGADNTEITATGTHGIFFINGSGISVTIEDVTLSSGEGAVALDGVVGGGAIKLQRGSLTVNNCEFRDNAANQGGGGNFAYGGAVILFDNASFLNCTFDNNSVSGTNAQGGGAVYIDEFYRSFNASFTNCTFINNSASNNGGAIDYAAQFVGNTVSLTLTNCTFFDNSAGSNGDDVNAFTNNSNATFITHNTIYDRSSSSSNTSLRISSGTATITSRGGNIWWDTPSANITTIASDDVNQGVNSSGIASSLAANNTLNGVRTLSITGAGSLANDNGTTGFAETTTDARGAIRNGTIDSGAYEFWVAQGVLPVELTSFTATQTENCILLEWETETEINNYGFEVERQQSENGTQNTEWETIGFVQGHGNSGSPKSYRFLDENYNKDQELRLQYRLRQIDTDGTFTYYGIIAEVNGTITSLNENQLPTEFSLSQNYPNPFNPTTTIKFSIPVVGLSPVEGQHVSLKIYDILGNEVSQLVNQLQKPGNYRVEFDASRLTSGVYIYSLVTGSYSSVKKMTLIK